MIDSIIENNEMLDQNQEVIEELLKEEYNNSAEVFLINNSIYAIVNGKVTDLRKIISYNDPKTFEYLANANYMEGIFQLKSGVSVGFLRKMFKHLLLEKDLKDITEFDIITRLSDITTLIRPACIDAGADKRYWDRMCGKNVAPAISLNSPFYNEFYKVTSITQLELLYQEQIMRLLEFAFNISAGNADNYRRAFEKNDTAKLDKYKKEFWNLWKDRTTVEYCKEFWKFLLDASGYLFNLSHAVAYSMQTYITAYIKVHEALMIAVSMNVHSTDLPKVKMFLSEAFKLKIEVNLPKMNDCYKECTAVINGSSLTDKIFLSPNSIKGIGKSISNRLSSENSFESIESFLHYASKMKMNKAVMSILIKTNFFSEFNKNKEEVWNQVNNFMFRVQENREMKFIKKYNRFIYKPKKGEELINVNEIENVAIVEVRTSVWNLGEYSSNYRNEKWEQFYTERALLGYPLIDVADMYNIDLEENQKIIIVESVRVGSKGDYKYSIITDTYQQTYFIGGKHITFDAGFVLLADIKETAKGVTMLSWKNIDYVK